MLCSDWLFGLSLLYHHIVFIVDILMIFLFGEDYVCSVFNHQPADNAVHVCLVLYKCGSDQLVENFCPAYLHSAVLRSVLLFSLAFNL